ncbi:MAG: hypothetical protein KDB68_07930 [Planctomycetes bacterium]|nr:hypothetical protein [Planctomycetota bacterium]MCA8936121.1 hypothetical protein [Planctomycetota bacterium]
MEGQTPWPLILMMFAYAFVGWSALFAIHYHIRKRRADPKTARQAALGYAQSWQTTRSSDL